MTSGAATVQECSEAIPPGARVLVTGASGFIGSHLVRRLVADGARVHALTSAVSSVYPVRLVDLRDVITLHAASLDDRSAMAALARVLKPEYVFHLGAYTHVGKSWERIEECISVNIQGTVNLLRSLDHSRLHRFVNMGTSEIYGDVPAPFREGMPVRPVSPYAASKQAAEQFCALFHQAWGWPVVLVRGFNAYGPAQTPDRVIPEIIVRLLLGERVRMTEGRQTREFNFVEDLVDGIVRAAGIPGVEGRMFNIGCGEDIAIRDVASLIVELLDMPHRIDFGALPERPTEILEMRSDNTLAREVLGWKPQHSLVDGLGKTIDWYRRELQNPMSPFVVP